ncbi:MAG TPA: zinc ribbon domain-containing protein [bacterium]|nr:zinc ribbon domain-containing protein [bacterium]
MPIYEFYCKPCNTIYQFFSRSVTIEKIPGCPVCDNPKLDRAMSVFAALSGTSDEDSDGELSQIDEARMERAMAVLAKEAERIDENDPKQAANFMRRLSREAGVRLGPKMEEALSRMEKGEDPDDIEADLGDDLNEDELFVLESRKRNLIDPKKPRRDDRIYDL